MRPELQYRQSVFDAMTSVQVIRERVLAELDVNPAAKGVEVLGPGYEEINAHLFSVSHTWREVLSVQATHRAAMLRRGIADSERLAAVGGRASTVYNYATMDTECRAVLRRQPGDDYRFGYAPMQIKIIDGLQVLIYGRWVDEVPTVLKVRSPQLVAAAKTYWQSVLATSYPCHQDTDLLTALTARQRRIVALLETGITDEAIARTLAVSVRTVRSDIASVMSTLGVHSRFAAGLRIAELA